MKRPSERSYKSNSYKSRYNTRSKASQRKRFMYIKFEQIEMGKGFILLKLVQIEIVIFCRFIKKRSFCIDFIDLIKEVCSLLDFYDKVLWIEVWGSIISVKKCFEDSYKSSDIRTNRIFGHKKWARTNRIRTDRVSYKPRDCCIGKHSNSRKMTYWKGLYEL